VCALAHVFESAGIATVSLVSVLDVAQRTQPPRALYAEFPLGRPLGKPLDAPFQRRVLDAAFGLLDAPEGPVLETFPEVITSEVDNAVACSLPPRMDPDLPAAVDEARALRDAWDRATAATGRTSVGRTVDADGIPGVLEAFQRIADGADWTEAQLPGLPIEVVHDVRSYYEELCVELVQGAPEAWAAEHWFYEETEAGKLVQAARRSMRDNGAPGLLWFYMAPAERSPDD
jgi:hypothetical protein